MIIDPNQQSSKAAELLPNYETAVMNQQLRNLPAPITYTFSSWAKGSMLLLPPPESPNRKPLYKITMELDLNPFLPVSYLTKILRCGDREGEIVAEFAFALNNKRAVLRMKDTTTRLSHVLYSVNSSPKHFNWILENRLHWDCRTSLSDGSPMCICYLPPTNEPSNSRAPINPAVSIQIASFIPPPVDASPPLPEATITIFPAGHPLMDEILISALVVERMLTR